MGLDSAIGCTVSVALIVRDWAALKKVVLNVEEAKIIKAVIGVANIRISAEDFQDGLEVNRALKELKNSKGVPR